MRPTDSTRSSVARAARTCCFVAAVVLFGATTAWASLPQGELPAPRTTAPLDGAVVYESGVRLAWQPPAGASTHYVLLSHEPFDTRGWTALPDAPALRIFEVDRPIVSLAELGVSFDDNTQLYWAAASGFAGRGPVSFSDVQSNIVRPKFTNRMQPSPYLVDRGVERVAFRKGGAHHDRLHLGAGYTIDPSVGDPVLPATLRESAARASTKSFLVAYGEADPVATRHQIEAAGGTIIAYVPDRAFLVRVKDGLGATPEGEGGRPTLESAGDWVGVYHPAYKLSPRLELDSVTPSYADVLVFPDGDLRAVRAGVQALGASVIAQSDNGINKILRIAARGADVQGLAQHADVAWIEPYVQPQMFNNNAQWVVQTDFSNWRRLWDEGLMGEGQVIMTSDSGVNMGHHQFRDDGVPVGDFGEYPTHRKVIAYQNGSANPDVQFGDHGSFHGSHTAGSALGNDDPNSTSPRDGMAKQAKLWFMDISGAPLGTGVDPFIDLNDLFQPSYDGNAAGAARLSSNSWGASLNGAYTLNSQQVDQFMWNNKDYLIVVSNGNAGAVGTVASPATSKSCIGAGGTGNGSQANQLYFSTSKGPTQDGRQKPTICSPGQSVTSSISGVSSYATYSGTSMASPTMTGAIALIRQYLTEGWYPTGTQVPGNAFDPSAALLKAMAINSAANDVVGQTAPNNNIGYGRILADDVCYFAGDSKRLLLVDHTQGLGHLDQIEYQINVTTAGQPLEVSLCWSDYPGSPLAAIQLVNDLNLEVVSPGGVATYLGNRYVGGWSVTGGTADDRDVEEAVLVQSAADGIWTVRVIGENIPLGPQPFALAMTGEVGTDAGTIALDRASYGSTSTVEIQVTDTNAGATVDVAIVSTTEPTGETVTLAQTGTGIYTGSITLSPFDGAMGDNLLQVSHGDLISATYDDGAPSLLVALTAEATVSIESPTITNVASSPQGLGSVGVTWDSDLNATSQVYYGTTPALGSATTVDPTAALTHSVRIDGLTSGATYYFDVESQALNGNLVRDDNGGNHYKFTVGGGADLLIVTDGDFDNTRWERYVDALDANGWIYDVWNAGQHADPPVGDSNSGMRSYKAIWWQVGLELYPPFSDAARDSITAYLDGGGRMVAVGHDIVWAFGDVTSSFYTPTRSAWLSNTLHTQYVADPAGWTNVGGVVADPISGDYTATVPYSEHRSGASGDEINTVNGAGTASTSWLSGDPSPDDAGLRWESNSTLGTPGLGFWGGMKTRLATMYFEWSGIDNLVHPSSANRSDILDKTLIWLLGRDKPDLAVTSPNGGETFVANMENITWSEATFGGTNVDTRKIEYSPDGGLSWSLVTADAGAPPPYAWDLSSVSNTPAALIRITLSDDGMPSFSTQDRSDATFTIDRPGGDGLGPVVVAGSIGSAPNPIDNQNPATLSATVSDLTTGGSNVMAAEWSFGAIPANPGSGNAMAGTFGTPTVDVSAVLATADFSLGEQKLWVRAQDDEGNWGAAKALSVVINGVQPLGVPDRPLAFELWQNAPNPVVRQTTIAYAVPVEAPVDLSIFDVQGRVLRRLVRGNVGAGVHQVVWDGTDDQGRPVGAGVYYYRFTSGDRTFERRLVTLR